MNHSFNKMICQFIVFFPFFREHAKKLMLENDQLQSSMVQNEQESIEIFTLLQQNEEKKNSQVHIFTINHLVIRKMFIT